LYVTPLPIPAFAPTSNGFFTDTLEVTTANGTADITLNETALGGVLAFNKASIAFTPPTISSGTSITSPVSITNSGNLSVSVSFAPTPSVFTVPASVTAPSSTSITAGTSIPINVTFTPAAPVTAYNGDWNMTVIGTMCAPLPAPDETFTGTSK